MRVNMQNFGGEREKVETVGEFDIPFENSQVMEVSKDKLFWEILENLSSEKVQQSESWTRNNFKL